MARKRRGKMSLYEVMSKWRFKSGYDKTLEKLSGSGTLPASAKRFAETSRCDEHPGKTEGVKATSEPSGAATPKLAAQWWRKPRAVQFNAGRIEFSMPYPLAIAVVLGIVLLVLLAFRFGQRTMADSGGKTPQSVPKTPIGQGTTGKQQSADMAERMMPKPVSGEKADSAKATGNNVIVLVEYMKLADLVPVQKHFAQYGIETEIVNWGGRYFLITKDRFEGFLAGSDGYETKRKIVEVGAEYKGKAPEGYETFAPHFFKDAYGRKVE